MGCKIIRSINELIGEVFSDYSYWVLRDPNVIPWFRGEPKNASHPLLPKLFRSEHDEKKLLQEFRMRSPSLGGREVPARNETDKWTFLAQHVGLPTRLLDWSEGLLFALHFCLYSKDPGVIWMLNPDELNRLTDEKYRTDQVQLTWFDPSRAPLDRQDLRGILYFIEQTIKKALNNSDGDLDDNNGEHGKFLINYNRTWQYFHYAWTGQYEGEEGKLDKPWAVPSTNIHQRMSSQGSRYTIHGMKKDSLADMNLSGDILQKYEIAQEAIDPMRAELRILGVNQASLFPELDGIAKALAAYY